MRINNLDTTPFFTFDILGNVPSIKHGFSTKLGGVSTGYFSTLNLGLTHGDDPAAVQENYRRITESIGIPYERCVISHQEHTTNVMVVTESDAGSGTMFPRPYDDVDGLITNIPGIPLVTYYADCVPLFFVDPVKKAIGLSHSGWRGTVAKMGKVTVEAMTRKYGCDPADIIACVGPCICMDCYEVSADVAEHFMDAFPSNIHEHILKRVHPKDELLEDKYLLNLKEANRQVFLEAGILPEHIEVAEECTKCDQIHFYSHRVSGTKRGLMGAFLCLNN